MSRVLIIAEAGVNHNGSLERALEMVDVAFDAGADYVKFQTFKTKNLVSHNAQKASYQKKNLGGKDDSQFDMLKSLELSNHDHKELIAHCAEKGIGFLSTGFDEDSVAYLHKLGIGLFKIPSGEITNYPYLRFVAKLMKPVVLSTGMSTLAEIEVALKVLTSEGLRKKDITVLHCNTEYPTPMKDVNLKAMNTIGETFGVQIGYSDHTLGIEVSVAAVARGACVIEKHFTLDKNLSGPDHAASLEPKELKNMVQSIRNIELALSGSSLKEPSESELKNIPIVRKSIHLKRDVKQGNVLSEEDLIPLRPGDGISPMLWEEVVGKKVVRGLKSGTKLMMKDIHG